MTTSPDNQAAMVAELRSSIAFTAGAGHKARQIAELLRSRATQVQQLADMLGKHRSHSGYAMLTTELRRLADQIEEMP
jgi:hypothetical protein